MEGPQERPGCVYSYYMERSSTRRDHVMPQLLTISGSLRTGSTNSTLLAAVARVAPTSIDVTSYSELAALPAFSPDIDENTAAAPPAVVRWRAALSAADA